MLSESIAKLVKYGENAGLVSGYQNVREITQQIFCWMYFTRMITLHRNRNFRTLSSL